ncbi:unnamed protein product [Gongylonema pulchrum]|uniref:Small ribosomal subunit protein mS31 n=1 Tax=Gongylonema pulchrum TaxID=637853 RepID=A0A183D3F3_9BILA|nr:unnamed protein product [Gongylonema pulchrum]
MLSIKETIFVAQVQEAYFFRIWNRSFGPTNAFEEMIELTEEGKMWPYPIDNEYQIGDEEDVPFYEHIFLDKYLAQYNLPDEGPVAQFMELVCIGLSKNPYMSIKKKHAHLDWSVFSV